MKISEIKNEDALDVICDLMEPAAEIFGDPAFAETAKEGDIAKLAKVAIKGHKKAVLEILAALNGVPVDEYVGTPITIMRDVLEILSDKELLEFFTSQGQIETEA